LRKVAALQDEIDYITPGFDARRQTIPPDEIPENRTVARVSHVEFVGCVVEDQFDPGQLGAGSADPGAALAGGLLSATSVTASALATARRIRLVVCAF